MKTHICPVEKCGRTRGEDKLVCFKHWAQVPRGLQQKLWAAWNRGNPNTAYEPLRAEVMALLNGRSVVSVE